MKIDVLFSPMNLDDLFFTGKTTVVIDVLRATTVIAEALNNGAKDIIPVSSVENAVKITRSISGGTVLLGGERNTKKIEGFNFGNSPLEYTKEAIAGKSIVLFTTNGSQAIVKAKFSEHIFTCSLTNINSVVNYFLDKATDVELLCSGKQGKFCIEDTICAGKLISELSRHISIELTDAAKASLVLFESFGDDFVNILSECEHGKLLIENGFEEDIKFCAQVGTTDILPHFSGGTIKIYKPTSVHSSEKKV